MPTARSPLSGDRPYGHLFPTDGKSKAQALAYYTRGRDDNELDVWMSEIRLRAVIRIGEQEPGGAKRTPKQAEGGTTAMSPRARPKRFEAAGINIRTAERYKELTRTCRRLPSAMVT